MQDGGNRLPGPFLRLEHSAPLSAHDLQGGIRLTNLLQKARVSDAEGARENHEGHHAPNETEEELFGDAFASVDHGHVPRDGRADARDEDDDEVPRPRQFDTPRDPPIDAEQYGKNNTYGDPAGDVHGQPVGRGDEHIILCNGSGTRRILEDREGDESDQDRSDGPRPEDDLRNLSADPLEARRCGGVSPHQHPRRRCATPSGSGALRSCAGQCREAGPVRAPRRPSKGPAGRSRLRG